MENYCDKCNVYIPENQAFCPLCGRCCNENNINKESNDRYPQYLAIKNSRKFVTKLFIAIIVTAIAFTFIIEWLYGGNARWYMLGGGVYVFMAILYPIRKNYTIVTSSSIFFITTTLYLLFLQIYGSYFSGNASCWAVIYVIPVSVWAYTIYCLIIFITRASFRWDFLIPLFLLFVISLIIFIYNFVTDSEIWPSLVALLITITAQLILYLLKTSKTAKELEKKFHI